MTATTVTPLFPSQPADARIWLPWALDRLPRRWTKSYDRPCGTLTLPREGLLLNAPLVLPARVSLRSPEPMVRDMPDLIVSDAFPRDEADPNSNGGWLYALNWEPTKGPAGDFNEMLLGVGIDCRSRAAGIRFRADQVGLIDGAGAWHFQGIGLDLMHCTRTEVRSPYLMGHQKAGRKRGTAISILRGHVTITGGHIHRCETGLLIDRSNCSSARGLEFEHTILTHEFINAAGCVSEHALIHSCGEVAIRLDEASLRRGCRVSGGIVQSPPTVSAHLGSEEVRLTSKGKSSFARHFSVPKPPPTVPGATT